MRATDAAIDFIHRTQLDDIPADVQHLGKRAILDTVGVSLAAAKDEAVAILAETLAGREGNSAATVIGRSTPDRLPLRRTHQRRPGPRPGL